MFKNLTLFLGFFSLVSINTSCMELQELSQGEKEATPLGCKNFSLPELNLQGICAPIAKFQLIAAGLHNKCQSNWNQLKGTSEHSELLLQTLRRYSQASQAKNDTPFVFETSEIKKDGLFVAWKDGCSSLVWNDESQSKYENVIQQCDFDGYDLYESIYGGGCNPIKIFLENSVLRSGKKPPLIIVNVFSDALNQIETIDQKINLKDLKKPHIPLSFRAKELNDLIKEYKLIGVAQKHNYLLKKNKFQKFLYNLFWHLFPSKFLMWNHEQNIPWKSHLDAYVLYNNIWYVMDDETRWKVSVSDLSTEPNFDSEQLNSDSIAQALTHCYPGVPCVLMYALVATQEDTENLENQDIEQASKKIMLTLNRETPEPSRTKSIRTVFYAGVLDGGTVFNFLTWGSISYMVTRYMTTEGKPMSEFYNFGLREFCLVGFVAGLASAAYHASHVIPKHYSKIMYSSDDQMKLGPRESLL